MSDLYCCLSLPQATCFAGKIVLTQAIRYLFSLREASPTLFTLRFYLCPFTSHAERFCGRCLGLPKAPSDA